MNKQIFKTLEKMAFNPVSAYWAIPGMKVSINKKPDKPKKQKIEAQMWSFIKHHLGLSQEQICLRCRKKTVVENRQLLHWYLLRQGFGLKEIGQLTGGYDHSTVINSNIAINNLIETNPIFAKKAAKFETYFDLWVS